MYRVLVFTGLIAFLIFLVFVFKDKTKIFEQELVQSTFRKPVIETPQIENNTENTKTERNKYERPDYLVVPADVEKTLTEKMNDISEEFAVGNYKQILIYGEIITLCNSVPRSDYEMGEWIQKHASQPSLDIKMMERNSKSCEHVERIDLGSLEVIYRTALNLGEKRAGLALARLIPYESQEKVNLLISAASWADEAVHLLAEQALVKSEFLSTKERLYWLSISGIDTIYGEQFDSVIADLRSKLSLDEILEIEKRIDSDRS